MAEDQDPLALRTRVLTNYSADFVQTTAGQAIIGDIVAVEDSHATISPVFVPEIDSFVPNGEAPKEEDYYALSSEKMAQFQNTLKSFCKIIKKQQLDKKLGIRIKEPREYQIDDVLEVAKKLADRHKDSDNTTKCMRVIRKAFRVASKHKTALTNLLSFAPSDVYGSVLCGAFTVILAGIEAHEKLREDIQTALSDIPKKLDNVQRLQDVHVQSGRLKICADAVFIDIFVVLERIVDRLSMGLGEKIVSKVKGHSGDINNALTSLDNSVADFQAEVRVCAEIRMGRIEETGNRVKSTVKYLATTISRMDKEQQNMKKLLENQQKFLEGRTQTTEEKLQAALWNRIYQFLASDPAFNAIDGTVDVGQARQQALAVLSANHQAIAVPPTGSVIFSVDRNRDLVNAWLKNLPPLNPDPSKDITECLNTVESLDLAEKDQIQWIMNSDPLYEWLSRSQSCVLEIKAETPPERLDNSLSFTAALLARTLASTADFPVLSFFCGLRSIESRREKQSGPIALLNSLNGQLLRFIVERRPAVDLSFLDGKEHSDRAREKPKHALDLLDHLLGLLPAKDAVFIVIDSFSRLSGTEADGDKVLQRMVGIVARHKIIVKVLVTDPLPSCSIKHLADLSLLVPDHTDGGSQGINVEMFKQENSLVIQQFQVRQQRGDPSSRSSSGAESDEDDW